MDIEVLKSYLVDLGFAVNQPELRKFEGAIKDASSIVETHTAGIVKDVLKWQTAFTGAFTGISAATIGLVDHVAMADQQYRLFGLRMFMTTEQARKLQRGTEALGASIAEIAWDPELHSQFLQLAADRDENTRAMGTDFEANLRKFRALRFEFVRMKENITDVAGLFVNSLLRMFGTDLDGLVAKFDGFNQFIKEKLPAITNELANDFGPVLQETWGIVREGGIALSELANLFTNFIGILTGDQSLEGTEFSFEKLGKAMGEAGGMLDELLITVTHAEQMFIHFASVILHLVGAAFDGLTGRFGAMRNELGLAVDEAKAGFKQISTGTGAVTGGVVGGGVGAGLGGTYGATVGATLGSFLGPVGTAGGSLLGAAAGSVIAGWLGAGVGAGVGAGAGAIKESFSPSDTATRTDLPLPQGASEIASRARELALKAGAALGVDPRLVFEQWQHETGGFQNRGAHDLNNLAGIRTAGGAAYRNFSSLDDFEAYYVSLLKSKRYQSQGISQATNEEQFAAALKRGGYYEDSYDHYVAGMKRFVREDSAAGATTNVTVGDVHVTVGDSNATPAQIQTAVSNGMSDAFKQRQTQRNLAQLAYVG